jgi:hypothetical protein
MTIGDEWTLADASCLNLENSIWDKGFPETLLNPDMCWVQNKDILNAIN